MAAFAAAGIIDPTKPGEYPVVLSDALLSKSGSTDVYTGVRYNHKPTLSSDTAPSTARIKPNNASFDLSFQDNKDKYAYSGSRATKDGQYVLIFDPTRKAFVLHSTDSIFNMNLTRTPSNNDPDSLREEHPHLDNTIRVQLDSRKGQEKVHSKAAAKPSTSKSTKDTKKKPDKEKVPTPLTLPDPEPPKPVPPKKMEQRPVESEEEDDSDEDGGLVLEFPEGQAPSSSYRPNDFSPAFPPPPVQIRRFSEFERANDDEDADADGEDEFDVDPAVWEADDNNMEDLKLPSPVNNPNTGARAAEGEDEDMDDIEAEMEKALMESDVSEED